MEYFCCNCGTKTDGNATKEPTGAYTIRCPDCLIITRFRVILEPSRTQEEADSIFQQTELTDSQRGSKKRFTSQNKK